MNVEIAMGLLLSALTELQSVRITQPIINLNQTEVNQALVSRLGVSTIFWAWIGLPPS